jgi:hypothetical protein
MIRETGKDFFVQNFDYHYSSEHKDYEGQVFTLYLLMLGYSSNIAEIYCPGVFPWGKRGCILAEDPES